MKILAQTPKYIPDQYSGGETMLHDYLKLLVDNGNEVWVIADAPSLTELEGVQLFDRSMQEVLYKGCDIVITHLGSVGNAVNKCRKYKKPLIYIVHNDFVCSAVRVHPWINVLYNSEWCAKKLPYKGRSVICRPIINYDKFKDIEPNGEYVTMVNINKNKGGEILREIANRLPQYKFQAVLGGYQEQVLPQPDNVKILPNGSDMVEVYKSSKMVIVPSAYESWGRVAAEAIVSGLHVVHTDTLGLKEVTRCMATIVYDREDIEKWVQFIRWVSNASGMEDELIQQRKTELLEQAEEDKLKFLTFVENIQNDKDYKSKSITGF